MSLAGMPLERLEVLSFDCYGTLIDWEAGILGALQTLLQRHCMEVTDAEILSLFAAKEAQAEAAPYQSYRRVLRQVVVDIAEELRLSLTRRQQHCLADSIAGWEPYPDTVAALRELGKRYRLAILSNVDDDLFALSAAKLPVSFDWVITAQQVGSYKPAPRNFLYLIEQIGVPANSILHVARSLYHDIVPADQLGLKAVWVNRQRAVRLVGADLGPAARAGADATPAVEFSPSYQVPDLETLARLLAG